jgi:hypothetical protein
MSRSQLGVLLAEIGASLLIYLLIYRGGIPMYSFSRGTYFVFAAVLLQLCTVVAVAFVTWTRIDANRNLPMFVLLCIPGSVLSQFRESTIDPVLRIVYHLTGSYTLGASAEFVVTLLSLFIFGFLASLGRTRGGRALIAGSAWVLLNLIVGVLIVPSIPSYMMGY